MHNPLHTPICDRLGIEYPVFLAGTGGVSPSRLVPAVPTAEFGGMALIPRTVDAVSIPVIAAGGLADGRGLVAALALGAQGAISGTRFIASPEAQAAPGYRDAIVGATEADTVRTRCYTGKPARAIRNQYTDEWEQKPDQIQPFPMQAGISIQNRVMDYMGVGNTFDATRTFLPAGQSAGLVHEIKPAGQIVRDIIEEAQQVIESRFLEPSLQKQKA